MDRPRVKLGVRPMVLLLATDGGLAASTARCLQDARRPFRLLSLGRYLDARASRWCTGGSRFNQPELDDDALAWRVKRELTTHRLACVVPAGIEATLYLAAHQDQLAADQRFPLAPRSLLDQLNNKWRFHNLVASIGIPQPKTFLVESSDDFERVTLTPPVVVKPLLGQASEGVTVERAAQALRHRIESAAASNLFPLLVQEYIPGVDQGACALVDHGMVLACRVHRGELDHSQLEYTQDQDVAEGLTALVRATDFHGILNLDFRRDARDGSLKAIECNPRLFGTVYEAACSGANLVERGLELAGRPDSPRTTSSRPALASTVVMSLSTALRALVTGQPMSTASRHLLRAAARDPLSTLMHLVEGRVLSRWPRLAARIRDEPSDPHRFYTSPRPPRL